MQRAGRMKRELQILQTSPSHGISCWAKDKLDNLEAKITGPDGTPYEKGIFKLDIQIPERYPFEPPKITFVTPIYHPNIDNAGRICLDSLKMPPKGAWKPALNISTLLTSIQLLMSEPNPEDPLMTDIANEFKLQRVQYEKHAREYTLKYAVDSTSNGDKASIPNRQDMESESLVKENSCQNQSSSVKENSCQNQSSSMTVSNKRHVDKEAPIVLKENVKRLKQSGQNNMN